MAKKSVKRPTPRAKSAKRAPARAKTAKRTVARPKAKASPRKAARPKARKQPETLRLRSAVPGFTVADLQRSIHFYSDILGFVEADRWEQDGRLMGVHLKAGSVVIMIGQDDFAKGRDRVKGVGHRIWCKTGRDLDQLAAQFKARGAKLDIEPHKTPWGDRLFALSDPDGFKITFRNGD
ncbi:MAG: VOC family protein [Gemmatimonadota bacterium]